MSELKTNYAVEEKHSAFFTGGRVQITKDGNYISCQCETSVQILTLASGKVYKTLKLDDNDDDSVVTFVLSPDDEFLVVAYKSLVFRQWNWKETVVTRQWKSFHTAPIQHLSYDVTSTLLASASSDGSVKVWDTLRNHCTNNLRHSKGGVVSLSAFHPDTERLQLVTVTSQRLHVWNLKEKGGASAELAGHVASVTCVQFSGGDASKLYSSGRDNVVLVWCMKTYVRLSTIPVFESLEALLVLPDNVTPPVVGSSADDPHFITAGSNGSLRVWNATTRQCVHEQPLLGDNRESAATAADDSEECRTEILALSYNSVLDRISAVTQDHNIFLYERENLRLQKQLVGHSDDVLGVAFIDSTRVVVATNSAALKLMNLSTGDVQLCQGHRNLVMCVATSTATEEKSALVASGDKAGVVLLWRCDVNTGRLQCMAQGYGHTKSLGALTFSRLSTTFLVSGSHDLTLKMWHVPNDLDMGKKVKLHVQTTERGHDKDINSVDVSPNDRLVATGSQDKTLKVWSTQCLKLLGVCRGHTKAIWSVKFSPIDQCVASSSADGSVRVWALNDYTCVKTFQGHDASVLNVQFLTRGTQLVTSGSDGLLKLWTIKSSECTATLDAHDARVWALDVSGDEQRLVSGAGDSSLIVWKNVTEEVYETERAKQEEIIIKQQAIVNLLQQKRYLKALKLAIDLEQPLRAFSIIRDLLIDGQQSAADLDTTLVKLKAHHVDALLRYAVTWNTNSRHCHVAQHVLGVMLRSFTPEHLRSLPNFRSSLEGLLPYSERHMQRMGRLLQQSTFVDYTWQSMRLAAGDSTEAESVWSEPLLTASSNRDMALMTSLNALPSAMEADDDDAGDSDEDSVMSEDDETSVQAEDVACHEALKNAPSDVTNDKVSVSISADVITANHDAVSDVTAMSKIATSDETEESGFSSESDDDDVTTNTTTVNNVQAAKPFNILKASPRQQRTRQTETAKRKLSRVNNNAKSKTRKRTAVNAS